MEPEPQTPWYKRKIVLIPAALLGVCFLIGLAADTPTNSVTATNANGQAERTQIVLDAPAGIDVQVTTATAPTQAPEQPAPKVETKPAAQLTSNPGLSNDNYYTNVSGNTVHSPAYSDSVPAGASARCRDGTYSFSQHRSGTCSHHGGVASWL